MLELEEFYFTYFPKNKKIVVFSYGNIYQQETNFKIALILKELDVLIPQYFLVYINLKDIAIFPIGTIVDKQKKVNEYEGLKVNLLLDLEKVESKTLFEIPELKKQLVTSAFPNKINNFSSKYHIQGQYYFILKDENTDKNVYISHYEVARWFYFTTPSMTKQILSASLKDDNSIIRGLYKNINHIDSDLKEITLTQNTNTNDAANIFRYATDKFSNNSWYQVRRNLTASAQEIRLDKEQKGYLSNSNEMKLKVDFPIKQTISLNARVKVLDDGSFFVLKFINEDSSYDFETLFIKIERKNKPDEPIGVIKKTKTSKTKISKQITNNTPNKEFLGIRINNQMEDLEERLDLKTKKIERKIEYIDEEEFIQSEEDYDGDKEIELSTDESESGIDNNTGELTIENQEQDNKIIKEYLTLSDFKSMLFECSKENKEFFFCIQMEDYLPQKSENDRGNRRKWKKAKLIDGKTKRKFLAVVINYKNKNFILIEIERDLLVDGLSTLIIWDKDNSIIDDFIISSIVKNFVYENGRWLKNYEDFIFNKDFLEHPKDENKNRLKNWYQRLIQKIE
ncbi:MAG: Tn7-like element transposition protein TnsE [Arcobacter sp.]|uniref:Tn7-like element transposition protein TnsE n=1 Tax=Arcobacter sp. TaxID=1872629 RepID=UPI003D049587